MTSCARIVLSALFCVVPCIGGSASAQCILDNPSFELIGGGTVFGGWNQFGPVSSSDDASHGQRSARVLGPDVGNWAVTGLWQALDSAPGDRWRASVRARHRADAPLLGASRALLNVEWRDAGDVLLSYESHTVADAVSALDVVHALEIESGAAPAGTVSARILVGVLQGPGDPRPAVLLDEVRFERITTPSIEDAQWNDFPGGRVISFGGRSWRVKGPGFYGPGPNVFCDAPECVWVDALGRLHLTVSRQASTEVTLEEALGYGDHRFTLRGALHTLDPYAVLGLFLWEYPVCFGPGDGWWNPANEIDVEIGRFGDPARAIGQFVAQPWDFPGNLHSFDATFGDDEISTYAMRWRDDRVEFRAWRGGPYEELTSVPIASWTYTGPHVARNERPRVHLNLWQVGSGMSSVEEIVVENFVFVPWCPDGDCGPTASAPLEVSARPRLHPARPNPFNPSTTIDYTLVRDEEVSIDVFDVAGRHVRTLVGGVRPSGTHTVSWDGNDDTGRPVASGVYLYRLRTPTVTESRRMVLVE